MVKRIWVSSVQVVGLALFYFAAGKLGLTLAFVNPSATAVWPPTGIALAACLLLGYQAWPGILLGAFLVNATTSGSIPTSFAIAIGNTLEGLVGAYLVNRFAHGPGAFDRAQNIFKFTLLAGLASPMVSATIGVTSLMISGLAAWTQYAPIWLTWWLGDATGAMIIAPPLILWTRQSQLPWSRWQILEAAALFLSVVTIGLAIFGGWPDFSAKHYPLEFIILPLIVWSAFRFGPTGAATITLILSGIAVWGTLQGLGPFTHDTPNEALLLLQVFMGTVALTGLGLAAVVAERRRAEESLRISRDQLAGLAADNARLYEEAQALNAELETRVAQRTLALERSQAEAHALSGRLLTAREEERAEVAREIHDELGQQLTGLKMDLVQVNKVAARQAPGELSARLGAMSALLDDTFQAVRRLATNLRPSILDDFGLPAALEWQLQELQKRTGMTCQFESTLDTLDLKPATATALFRVFQEALTNIARHAQATLVEMRLNIESGCLIIQIRDNGRGITEPELQNSQSLGLMGMRERVHLIEGHLEINGAPGQGTTVRVTVPWP